jgi:hypothetical protein
MEAQIMRLWFMLAARGPMGTRPLILPLGLLLPPAATAQSFDDCKKIIGAIERLDCFDKLPPSAAPKSSVNSGQPNRPPSKPALSADEQLIAKARAAVTKQLRDPNSAQFRDMTVKSGPERKASAGWLTQKMRSVVSLDPNCSASMENVLLC